MDKKKFSDWPVALLLIFIFFLYSYNLTGWLINDDEGGYLYQAWRMTEGGVPYKDFYTPKEPLFLFTGYLIFKLFGTAVFWARMFSVLTTILTGYLIFLIGRRVYNYTVGLLGSIFYLTLPVVFFQARLYRSDAHAIFFSTLGLFLFIKAWQDNRRSFFAYSGIFYALSICYKFSGALGAIAVLLFILYQAAIEKKSSIIKNCFLFFISGFITTMLIVIAVLSNIAPGFVACLIGHQAHQPLLAVSNLLTTIMGNLRDLLMITPRQYGLDDKHLWLIIFSLPVLTRCMFIKKDLRKIFSFYAISIVFLLFNPYPGANLRYTLYFLPTTILVFAGISFNAFDRNRHVIIRDLALLALFFSLVKVFIPGLLRDFAFSGIKENSTLALAEYIRGYTTDEDYVVADYGDVIFYAKRKTTPSMAAMSKSTVECGVITSSRLIYEFEKYRVKMVLIHKEGNIPADLGFIIGDLFGPHHFNTLINSPDGGKFLFYLHQHYRFMGNFQRTGQVFDVYVRK